MVGSPIIEIGSAGSGAWKHIIDRDTDNYKRLVVKITSQQFTDGGNSADKGTWCRTLNVALPILWPSTVITTRNIKDLGIQLMANLDIIDHDVMGKLLEMEHWHNIKYYGY